MDIDNYEVLISTAKAGPGRNRYSPTHKESGEQKIIKFIQMRGWNRRTRKISLRRTSLSVLPFTTVRLFYITLYGC